MSSTTISSLLLLTILATLLTLACTSTAPPTSEVLWDRYQQVLMSFIKKTNDASTYKGLQVVTEPLDATWDAEGNEHVLSLLLDSSSRYGSVYDPSSLKFSQEYESFLFNLKFPQTGGDAQTQDKMWALRDRLMEQEFRRIQAQNLCYDDFTFFKELSAAFKKMSYKEYEDTECKASMAPIHRELMALNSDLVTLTTKLDGPHRRIVDAISRYSTDVNVGEYRETKTSLKTFLERARTNAGTPVSFALNAKTELSEKRDWIQKKKSGFLMFKKKSTTVKSEYRFQSELFEMKISADSMGRIDVAPKGDWFSATAVRSYKNDKSMWIDANKQFFGKSGTMPLIPKTIYVMYNPKVTLECSEKDAYTLNEMSSSSFTFGPFSKSKGSTLNIEKINEKNYRVTFESNSNTAHIIAIDHEVFE